ncbi:MAG: hypothetical protein EOP06_02055 [Proteobacteria bacterium]|nr:MAG: hypothetical protein EOP06_02055 [Pseudomonadota bacterium]
MLGYIARIPDVLPTEAKCAEESAIDSNVDCASVLTKGKCLYGIAAQPLEASHICPRREADEIMKIKNISRFYTLYQEGVRILQSAAGPRTKIHQPSGSTTLSQISQYLKSTQCKSTVCRAKASELLQSQVSLPSESPGVKPVGRWQAELISKGTFPGGLKAFTVDDSGVYDDALEPNPNVNFYNDSIHFGHVHAESK